MRKGEKLALFLGMLSGDGCLSIAHNGEGYRNYPIDFCNTEKDKVTLFSRLAKELFGLEENIARTKRKNRKEIFGYRRHSRKTVEKLMKLGFPEGVKRDKLRVLDIIKSGNKREKLAFIQGVLITDGSIGKDRILFHLGSKLFLEDLSYLIGEFIGKTRPVKEFVQREIYKSYQLTLNKKERDLVLSLCRRATMVLGRS